MAAADLEGRFKTLDISPEVAAAARDGGGGGHTTLIRPLGGDRVRRGVLPIYVGGIWSDLRLPFVRRSAARKLLFLLLLCASTVSCCHGQDGSDQTSSPSSVLPQTFLRQPVDQTAIQGEHVTLPCRVSNKRGMLQWTKDGFGLGIERNLTGFDRYHMTGSDEEGEYDLSYISNSTLIASAAVFVRQEAEAINLIKLALSHSKD